MVSPRHGVQNPAAHSTYVDFQPFPIFIRKPSFPVFLLKIFAILEFPTSYPKKGLAMPRVSWKENGVTHSDVWKRDRNFAPAPSVPLFATIGAAGRTDVDTNL